MFHRILQIVPLFLLVSGVLSKRSLSASSLVSCMEGSQFEAQFLNVEFDPDENLVKYDIVATSEINDYIVADITVYAYGFSIIKRTLDLCDPSLNFRQFCPLYPGDVEVNSQYTLSHDVTKQIPGIAYVVPDIDATVRILIHSKHNETLLACIQTDFTNGRTVAHTGAKWATAVVAGIGLLTSAVMSTFGNSTSAAHIAALAVSLFLYFQSVVIISMEAVERVPPIASAWSQNLAWSMGLIRVEFMQKIFRWYVQATGGTPTQYLTSTTINKLVQRNVETFKGYGKRLAQSLWTRALESRSSDIFLSNTRYLLVLRGIKRVAFIAGIEQTSVCATGFTFFVLCGLVLALIVLVFKGFCILAVKAKWINEHRFLEFSNNWRGVLKGAVLRYTLIGFSQMTILSLWQFVERDSAAVIVLAVLFLIHAVGILAWCCYKTNIAAMKSINEYKNPAYILYSKEKVLDKYGFMYTQFNANRFYFGSITLFHVFIKACFIAFIQSHGGAQSILIFIVELAYLIALCVLMPYLNKVVNGINIAISVVMTLNAFFFMFFSQIFNQSPAVSSIMGWVFFILNAAFSFILLIITIVFCSMAIFSKNPDSKIAKPLDDRTSFQPNNAANIAKNNDNNNELFQLGLAATQHQNNWEEEMYNPKEFETPDESFEASASREDLNANESLGAKIVRKLSRNKLKTHAYQSAEHY